MISAPGPPVRHFHPDGGLSFLAPSWKSNRFSRLFWFFLHSFPSAQGRLLHSGLKNDIPSHRDFSEYHFRLGAESAAEYRPSILNDTALLGGDFFYSVSQVFGMFQFDRGKNRDHRTNDICGIQSPSESCFKDNPFTLHGL